MATYKASVTNKETMADGALKYTFKLYRNNKLIKEDGEGLQNPPLKTLTVVAYNAEDAEKAAEEYLLKLKAAEDGEAEEAPDLDDVSVS
jgi:hypothetical protein